MTIDYKKPFWLEKKSQSKRGPKAFVPFAVAFAAFGMLFVAQRLVFQAEQPLVLSDIQDFTPPESVPLSLMEPIEAEVIEAALVSPQTAWLDIEIKPGDTLGHLFRQLGLGQSDLYQVVHSGAEAKKLESIKAGSELSILLTHDGAFERLKYALGPTKVLHVAKEEERGWHSYVEHLVLEQRQVVRSSTIQDSFYLAGKRSGLDDRLIMQVANLFSWDIDFTWGIRPDDHFTIVHQEYFHENNKVQSGAILAATFSNQGRTYRVFRFEHANGDVGYYHEDGTNIKKAFLRNPVRFSRISSQFNLHGRHHPVLHKIRAHKGVDYAAPEGTEIKATGDGKVIYCSTQGGYGNVVKIQHGHRYTTVYAHLSRYGKGMRVGRAVKQGDIIGYVGKTGLASGPHLHYEFQIDGVHQNPLTVPLPDAKHIGENELPNFEEQVQALRRLLLEENETQLG